MKRFKAEYQNAQVTVNSPSFGRMRIDTTTADANEWANIKEFEFMIEDDKDESLLPKSTKNVPTYNDFTLNELREMFPDIKATSKKDFLAQIL